jgi:DNA-binding GntR family transcriptional regulator
MSNNTLTKPPNLTEWAYNVIKNDILRGAINSGEKLYIGDLALQMEVSSTPIREALLKLRNEGLVESFSRVGFFVCELTAKDLMELFELREITEGYAAEKAAPRLTDKDLAELKTCQEASAAALENGQWEVFNECEIAFHAFVVSRSQNKRLQKLVDGLKDLTARERRLALKSSENVRSSVVEHGRIVEALARKDGRLSGERMKEHLRNVYKRLLANIELPEGGKEGLRQGSDFNPNTVDAAQAQFRKRRFRSLRTSGVLPG